VSAVARRIEERAEQTSAARGPRGFRCIITLAPAHSGYCGSTRPNSVFYWAPRLNK
jgi:hypothetical protein